MVSRFEQPWNMPATLVRFSVFQPLRFSSVSPVQPLNICQADVSCSVFHALRSSCVSLLQL